MFARVAQHWKCQWKDSFKEMYANVLKTLLQLLIIILNWKNVLIAFTVPKDGGIETSIQWLRVNLDRPVQQVREVHAMSVLNRASTIETAAVMTCPVIWWIGSNKQINEIWLILTEFNFVKRSKKTEAFFYEIYDFSVNIRLTCGRIQTIGLRLDNDFV